MKKAVIGIVLAFLVGLTAGGSLSSGPSEVSASSSGHRVCVNKKTGSMRLASVKKCTSAERGTVFGADGANGAQGPAGTSGAAGPAGPAGTKGETGSAGTKGDAGSAGSTAKTKSVTLWYTSATTLGGCGAGTVSGSISGVLYDAVAFDAASLSSRFSWKPVHNCSVTLTVIDQ